MASNMATRFACASLVAAGFIVLNVSTALAQIAPLEIQNARAYRNAVSPDEHPIEFRIGVNLGDRSTKLMEILVQPLNGL